LFSGGLGVDRERDTSLICVLYRVAEEIEQHLAQARLISG
jgi:hypothetical protein